MVYDVDSLLEENKNLREEIKRLQALIPAKVNKHEIAPIKQLAPTDFSKWGMK